MGSVQSNEPNTQHRVLTEETLEDIGHHLENSAIFMVMCVHKIIITGALTSLILFMKYPSMIKKKLLYGAP